MKTNLFKLLAAGSALALLAGCVVLSAYPFYTPKELLADPGLPGRWVKTADTNEFWQFSDAGQKLYLVAVTNPQDTNCLETHLFQLEQYQFMDLLTTNRELLQMPMHLIAKVTRSDEKIALHFMDFGWLSALLETNPAVLRHLVVPVQAGDTNNCMVYLTADTKDLQKFLLQHADDPNAFAADPSVELKRVSP